MKKLFLGSVALLALGLGMPAAFAAERAVPAPAYTPPPPPVPVYTWSGCYAGASAGFSSGKSNRTAVVTTVPGGAGLPITGDLNLSGFIGGFDGGCNWQWGAWVFGIEGDWSATNESGQAFGLPPFNAQRIHETQERWLSTARGRLGWTVWDKTLVYVTGGGAWAKIDGSTWLVGDPIGQKFETTRTRSGWVVGAGAEYALGYGWSARAEYLYVDFGTNTTVGGIVPPAAAAFDVTNARHYDNIFRAGMNYKFW
jgi:outer membrane immunogenic protein